MPELVVENLSKQFGDVNVLQDVSFTVKDGEFFTLLGPSGCGKSTTLACIAGLERPSHGTIRVADRVLVDPAAGTFLQPEARNFGMVFQSYALWPHMTLANNLAFPLKIRKVPAKTQTRLVDDALDKVGLLHLRSRFPHQLSGGQQQRVALARALVYSPSILLLDEPLSNLDAKLREQARAWLKRLQRDLGITTVYVTHDQHEALALSDRVAMMSEGRMVQVGTPHAIYERPVAPEVAAFIGRCNFLKGVVVESIGDVCAVRLACNGEILKVPSSEGLRSGLAVTVTIRPEKLTLGATGDLPSATAVNVIKARVVQSAYIGARYEYELALGDQLIYAESSRGDLVDEAHVVLNPQDCLVYPFEAALSGDEQELSALQV
jgi:iron(III) transport system ATP-binding protein